jgi:hypothetical protein
VYRVSADAQALAARRSWGLDQWRVLCRIAAPESAGTSLGAAVEALLRDGRRVSRLVIVTDGQENRAPRLTAALERYRAAVGVRPTVQLVQPAGAATQLAGDLRNAKVPFAVFTVDRHLVGLDAFVPALRAGAGASKVEQILAFGGDAT